MMMKQGFVLPLNEKIYPKPWNCKTAKQIEVELAAIESDESL